VTSDNRYGIFSVGYGDFSGSHRPICIVALPDSEHVVIRNHDAYHQKEDTLHIFNLLTGRAVSYCDFEGVGDPHVTPNGRYIVFTIEFGYGVAVWDWQAGQKAKILFSQGLEECIINTLNSDGSKVVVTHYPATSPPAVKYKNPTLRVWDLETGKNIYSFPGYKNAEALPDKQKIKAMGEEAGVWKILDIENGIVEGILNK
jgi:WD40 repeat protein